MRRLDYPRRLADYWAASTPAQEREAYSALRAAGMAPSYGEPDPQAIVQGQRLEAGLNWAELDLIHYHGGNNAAMRAETLSGFALIPSLALTPTPDEVDHG